MKQMTSTLSLVIAMAGSSRHKAQPGVLPLPGSSPAAVAGTALVPSSVVGMPQDLPGMMSLRLRAAATRTRTSPVQGQVGTVRRGSMQGRAEAAALGLVQGLAMVRSSSSSPVRMRALGAW